MRLVALWEYIYVYLYARVRFMCVQIRIYCICIYQSVIPILHSHKVLCKNLDHIKRSDRKTLSLFTNTVSKMTKSKFGSLTHALKDQCLNKRSTWFVFCMFCRFSVFGFFFVDVVLVFFGIECSNHVLLLYNNGWRFECPVYDVQFG